MIGDQSTVADYAKVIHTTEECRLWKTQEEKDRFVEQPRKNKRAKKMRKVVAKWVAKEHTTTTTDPASSKAYENDTEPQGTALALAEEKFPVLAAPV